MRFMGNCNVIVLFLISVIVTEVGSGVGVGKTVVGEADGEEVGCSVKEGNSDGETVSCGIEVGAVVGSEVGF
jgi:hypothetical protein